MSLFIPAGSPCPLFLIGLVLCAFTALFSLPVLFAGIRTADSVWGPLGFLLCIWEVAGSVFLRGYHKANLQTVAAVAGDELLLLETGPLGSQRWQWSRAQVADICCGETAWAEGSTSVMEWIYELQSHLTEGKKIGLCSGRGAVELCWMAGVLRRAQWAVNQNGP